MLKLSKKTEYGILAIRHISMLGTNRVATVKEVALENNIPQPLLAKILQQLVKERMIRSVQGSHGGYVMDRDVSEITLADVVGGKEGPIRLGECGAPGGGCGRNNFCDPKDSLEPVQAQLYDFFKKLKLIDVLNLQQQVKSA